MTREQHLLAAVERVSADDTYVAAALKRWGGGTLDVAKAADALGCTRKMIFQLACCRFTSPGPSGFEADVAEIAAHVGVDEKGLREFLRAHVNFEAIEARSHRLLRPFAPGDRVVATLAISYIGEEVEIAEGTRGRVVARGLIGPRSYTGLVRVRWDGRETPLETMADLVDKTSEISHVCACGWRRPVLCVTTAGGMQPSEPLDIAYPCPECGRPHGVGELTAVQAAERLAAAAAQVAPSAKGAT